MSKSMGKRFALLCRVSTRGQSEGETLDVQEKRGREYVEQHHGTVVKLYRGVESATKSAEDRTLLQSVLRQAEAHQFDALWVINKSRLSRSPATTEVVLAKFAKLKIELHTAQGLVPIGSAEASFIAIIEAAADLLTSTRAKESTRDSREDMLAKGEHAFGRWPWGRLWDREAKEWKIDLAKQKRIRRAVKLYLEADLSMVEVAKRVGMAKSSLGKAFRSASLTEWPRTLTTQIGVRHYKLTIPALITRQDWAAVQLKAARNSTVRPGHQKARWMLQGLLRCWHCGGNLSGTPGAKVNGESRRTYRHLIEKRGAQCLFAVPAEIEDDIVLACAQILRDDKALVQALEKGLADIRGDLQDLHTEHTELDTSIAREKRKIERAAAELVEDERRDGGAVGPAREALRGRMRTAEAALKDLEARRAQVEAKRNLLTGDTVHARDVAGKMRRLVGLQGVAALKTMTLEEKRNLVTLVVGRLTRASPNGIYVKMRRYGGRMDVVWPWELRGVLADASGTVAGDEEHERGPDVERRHAVDGATVMQLANFANELTPLKMKKGSPRLASERYKKAPLRASRGCM